MTHLTESDEWEYQEADPGSGLREAWTHTDCPAMIEHVFNMDLANGDTSERFCIAAASVLGAEMGDNQAADAAGWGGRRPERVDLAVQEWTERLENEGYRVHWYAGDVTVTKWVSPFESKGTQLIRRPGSKEPDGVRCLDCGGVLAFGEREPV